MAGGIALVAFGAAAIVASIPMFIVGTRRVPVQVAPAGPSGSAGMTVAIAF